jgi:hypothetical protein
MKCLRKCVYVRTSGCNQFLLGPCCDVERKPYLLTCPVQAQCLIDCEENLPVDPGSNAVLLDFVFLKKKILSSQRILQQGSFARIIAEGSFVRILAEGSFVRILAEGSFVGILAEGSFVRILAIISYKFNRIVLRSKILIAGTKKRPLR